LTTKEVEGVIESFRQAAQLVGNTIATKLVKVGHQIMMGSRKANSDAGQEWLRSVGGKAQIGTFAEAAAFAEIVFDWSPPDDYRMLSGGRGGEIHLTAAVNVGLPAFC
jgi:NADP oxidoreductase coenzyme F420-dependent